MKARSNDNDAAAYEIIELAHGKARPYECGGVSFTNAIDPVIRQRFYRLRTP